MTATELERAAALAGLSASVHWQEVTGSTNADAVALALDGAPEWTLVGAYAYAKSDDAIWVNLYGGNALATDLADGSMVR